MVAFATLLLAVVAWSAALDVPGAAAAAAEPLLTVELNKLEPTEKGCRVYLVVSNPGTVVYPSVKLDLVTFQPDGVIGRRVAIDIGPVRPVKKAVKLFDIDATACDRIASVLVNDVLECRAESGPVPDCLSRIAFASLAPAALTTK